MPEQQYYTKTEAAEIFGVNPRTLERWLFAGKLKGARFGKTWKISTADMEALYDDMKAETAKKLKERNK